MNPSKMHIRILLAVLFSVFAAGCQQGTIPPDVVVSRTPFSSTIFPPTSVPSAIPTLILSSTSVPSVTPALMSFTPTPDMHHQLTYVATCQEEAQCLYAIEIGCLETENPCMGESHLLFEITKNGQGPRPPILSYGWSPDGQQIVIEATGLGGKGDVYIGDWAGQSWSNITNTPDNEGNPIWSPNGMYIGYTAKSGEPDYSIKIIRATPNGQESLELLESLTSLDFLGIHQISWSSNGDRLAFVHSDSNGYSQIFMSNLDGSELKQLTSQLADHFQPDFSPNDQWVVAIRQLDRFSPSDEIILIGTNSHGVIQVILKLDSYIYTPVWSPMGDWIAFASEVDGNKDIYIVRSDGTGLVNVTQSASDERAPAWRVESP